MEDRPFYSRKMLYVRTPGAVKDGGTIFDDRVIEALVGLGASVQVVEAVRISRVQSIWEGLRRFTSPTFFRYQWPLNKPLPIDEGLEVVISHEELSLVIDIVPKNLKKWVIFHNLPSAFDDRIWWSFRSLVKTICKKYENDIVCRDDTETVVLSVREMHELTCRLAAIPVRLLQPGVSAPFPVDPRPDRKVDIVFSGSIGWKYKRRDVSWFVNHVLESRKFDLTHIRHLYSDLNIQIGSAVRLGENELPRDGVLRLGIISDRFKTGFKLKAVWYIANYCVVGSPIDISEDFRSCAHYNKFLMTFRGVEDLNEIVSRMNEFDVKEFAEFRHDVLDQFRWDRQVSNAFSQL